MPYMNVLSREFILVRLRGENRLGKFEQKFKFNIFDNGKYRYSNV